MSNTRVRFSATTKNNDIIYAISTENFEDFSKLITEANVNSIIDTKNRYYAIHYAVKFNNEKMMQHLLNMGANPYLKTLKGEDAFDLSLKYQTKYVITNQLNNLKETNTTLHKTISTLDKKLNNLEDNNKYLSKSLDDLMDKNNMLKNQNNSLRSDNDDFKKNIDELKENIVLLKYDKEEMDSTLKTLKRKYSDLENSYIGLLNKSRKI